MSRIGILFGSLYEVNKVHFWLSLGSESDSEYYARRQAAFRVAPVTAESKIYLVIKM